jgi:hypothetical protein
MSSNYNENDRLLRIYLRTPGTPENARTHAGFVIGTMPVAGGQVTLWKNPRGFFFACNGIWAGYFPDQATAEIKAVSIIQAALG